MYIGMYLGVYTRALIHRHTPYTKTLLLYSVWVFCISVSLCLCVSFSLSLFLSFSLSLFLSFSQVGIWEFGGFQSYTSGIYVR